MTNKADTRKLAALRRERRRLRVMRAGLDSQAAKDVVTGLLMPVAMEIDRLVERRSS